MERRQPLRDHAVVGEGYWARLGIHIYQQGPAAKAAAMHHHFSARRQPTDMAEAAEGETGAT